MKRGISILLLLAAIGFFVITIITRQVIYASIGFLYLISGLSLGRKNENNSSKNNNSRQENDHPTEDEH